MSNLTALERVDQWTLEKLKGSTLVSYDHGGGRLYYEKNGTRELIADFYNADTRDYIAAAVEAVLACLPYLKDGETPAECIARNRKDTDGVLTLLAKEKRKNEAFEAGRVNAPSGTTSEQVAIAPKVSACESPALLTSNEQVQRFSGWGIAMMQNKPVTEYVLASDYDATLKESERLRAVLNSIANNSCCTPCQEAANVARVALGRPTLHIQPVKSEGSQS